jgi:endonuclease/exonuclease/phosphatase family metal-dependent hydrolase
MKRLRLPRLRTLVCMLVLGGLTALAASRRESTARARAERHGEHHEHHERPPSDRHDHARHPLAPGSPWASPAACENALARGGAQRPVGVARIGAWNLHWFPDGRPGEAAPGGGADLAWLACAIAWMKLDLLAVEEIKRPPRGPAGMDELTHRLDALTGGDWQSVLDDCPHASGQHVGLLYDKKRVTLRSHAVVGALNPLGEPCRDQLRPGLAGYFAFPGGLDLSIVAAHLKSGADERGIDDRARSFAAFGAAAAAEGARTNDRDVLFIGDMNTMGCETCDPVIAPGAELAREDAVFAAASTLSRVPAEPACSHHYGGRSILLDWAVRSDLAELPSGRHVVVSGACGELGCDALGSELPAQRYLSDHCPIWLDLDDVDRD